MFVTGPNLETFLADARRWLDLRLPLRKESAGQIEAGDPFSTAVFHSLSFAEEAALLGELRAWNEQRATRGYHAVSWPVEDGGLGLDREYGRAFARLEAEYETPRRHELFNVTTQLIAPTVRELGDSRQRDRFVGPLLRTEIYCCQLFSEPSAGSDLAECLWLGRTITNLSIEYKWVFFARRLACGDVGTPDGRTVFRTGSDRAGASPRAAAGR